MQLDPDKTLIPTNKLLGQQPSFFIVPANQMIPWSLLVVLAYVLTMGFFDFGLWAFLGLSVYFCVCWLALTGKHPHQFVDKFIVPPGREWYAPNSPYISVFPESRSSYIKKLIPDHKIRLNIPPRTGRNQQGQVNRYMAFQNHHNIVAIISIEKNGITVSGYLLNLGSKYQIIFPFTSDGYHNHLEDTEVVNVASGITEGLKEIPVGEKISIHTHKFTSSHRREQELSDIADRCKNSALAVLCRTEQKKVQELSDTGVRQLWKNVIFCSYTYDQVTGQNNSDYISKLIRLLFNKWNKFVSNFSGSKQIYQQQFYKELIINAFDKGFNPWETLLNTRLGLDARPLTVDESWEWLWYKFNSERSVVPVVPQILSVVESNEQVTIREIVNNEKHLLTVLTEGDADSSCPEHRRSQDTIWFPGRSQKCGVLTLVDKPTTPMTPREQLRWIYTVLSKDYVKDTEVIVEFTLANDFLVEESLSKIAKQSVTAQNRAIEKGAGYDAGAMINQEETFKAKRQLRQGAKCFHTAFVILVYRDNPKQLDLACSKLCNSFGTAKIRRERNIAWALWLSSMPTTIGHLLQNESALEDRRQVFTNQNVWRFFPLTIPKSIDNKGIELITSSGKPIYVDLCHEKTSRALIIGTSGSGKSVFAWQIILDHLRSGIPVIGMDLSASQVSSFETAIGLLGDKGAYYDLRKHSNNLLEPPDLSQFEPEDVEIRMGQWLNSVKLTIVEIAMGKVDDPHLRQRVTALITKTTTNFLADNDIILRYNRAFEHGFRSPEWQDMPVLSDWLKFCTKERLNLIKFEDLDKAAINQITTQVETLLNSSLGKAVGQPSTFSPNPLIKFFALSDLDNPHEQAIVALTCQSACMRNALSYEKSLIIGDELSVLFKMEGFANCFGNVAAVGRKSGISLVLISQDLDAILSCSARDQILQNINYKFIGRITASGAKSLVENLNYDPRIINQNFGDSYLPDRTTLSSRWLVETNHKYWQTSYYPSDMTLASVANGTTESKAREIVMSNYDSDTRGKVQGLKAFSEVYVRSIRQDLNVLDLVQS